MNRTPLHAGMPLTPRCMATAIGSMPHTDACEAVDEVLRLFPECPAWPQLPKRSFYESFCVQASEGLPGVRLDADAEKMTVDTGAAFLDEMADFYGRYLSEDASLFAMTEDYAAGLHELLSRGGHHSLVKGQLPGPVTWGLAVCDQELKASYYNDMMRDAMVKGLARKAQWQAEQLALLADEVLIFLDDPHLQSIGSSSVALHEQEVAEQLDEIISAIHDAGAYAGIHCCGNTDWGLLARTATDVISFDAWSYSEEVSLYAADIGAYLSRGGCLAWGIVPAGDEADAQSLESLEKAFHAAVGHLTAKGIPEDRILEQAFITPSCGTGTLTEERALRVMELTVALSSSFRNA